MSTLPSGIQELVNKWLSWDKNEGTRKEIQKLVEENNEKELQIRLAKRIAFGTAGLVTSINHI